MSDVLISGISGAMGKAVLAAIKPREDLTVTAGVDKIPGTADGIPVYSSFENAVGNFDVVIDFSNPALLPSLISYCKQNNLPAVICTTGFSAEQERDVVELSKCVPVFRSANMSLGVNLLAALAKKTAELIGKDFDIEIVEKHHRRKVDAPSGTAMMLANEINAACGERYRYVYERESVRQSRTNEEIGIHSIRGGTIVGEHDVIFAGTDEVITISHSASSRNVFATGAVAAALFLLKQEPGLHSMNDLM